MPNHWLGASKFGVAFADMTGDLLHVARSWRRRPAYAATLVCTLALGLGLAAAVFSFADGYLFRPLPFPSPDQLYNVRDPHAKIALLESDTNALRRTDVSSFGFVEWSAGQLAGSEMVIDGRVVPIWTYDVSPGFGQTLRVPLVAGRMFDEADHRASLVIPAWVSHRFWQREFGGDLAVLGRSFHVPGRRPVDLTIVGILAPEVASFDLNNEPPDLVLPKLTAADPRALDSNRLSFPIVRLPEGMTREQGEARIAGALQAVSPASDGRARTIQLRPLRDAQVAGGAPTARVLFSGALLILLLVAINLVHLLLAQGVGRAGEIATRAALGASRWRIVRLFLVESLALGVSGIGGGLLLGAWLSQVIASRVPRFPTVGRNLAMVPMLFDFRVVLFAVTLGLVIAVFGGCWPAWRAIRRPLHVAMRGASGIESTLPARISRVVLASELGVATILLLGTVFIGQGIWRYLHRPLGFSYENRLTIGVDLNRPPSLPPPAAPELAAIRGAIGAVPGVKAVGVYRLGEGRPVEVRGEALPKSLGYGVADGYFDAWQVRLVAGRFFSPQEIQTEASVAVVDATLARRAWPDGHALGSELRVGTGELHRVVGVVETQVRRLTTDPTGEAYVPRVNPPGWPTLVAWAPGVSPAQLTERLAPAVRALFPGAVVHAEPVTLTWLFNRQTGEAEFQGPIMWAFGLLTFALAGVGLFGLVSYLIAQRTREFGIRLALGARSQDIWRAVLRESVRPAIAGLVAGVSSAWALERFVRSSVFGWEASGVSAVAFVSLSLLVVSVIAAAGPARRALRIDPAAVLRAE